MPPKTTKRKASQQPGPQNKQVKRARSPTPTYMVPLHKRKPASDDSHDKKKNGDCRKDCRTCKDEAFEQDQLQNPEATFHHLYVCREKGRDGSPTLDEAGYELDYDKVSHWFKPTPIRRFGPSKEAKFEASIEAEYKEKWEMIHHFFEEGAEPEGEESSYGRIPPSDTIIALKERVEKDLGVPWHKVGVDDVKEWERKGYRKAKKGEYQDFSDEDRERFITLMSGASLRK